MGCTVPLCADFVVERAAINCSGIAGRGACTLVYFRTFSLSRAFKLVVTQVPASLAFAPEAAKQALAAACALAGYWADGALGVRRDTELDQALALALAPLPPPPPPPPLPASAAGHCAATRNS